LRSGLVRWVRYSVGMKKLLLVGSMAICVWMGGVANAQSRHDEKALEKTFFDSLSKQLLILQGFSADPEVDWRWTGHGLQVYNPQLRTLGALEASSVKLKNGRLEIKGVRRTVLNVVNGDLVLSEGRPVVLVVDLGDADPAVLVPQLKDDLFYGSLKEALLAVPPAYRKLLSSSVRAEYHGLRPPRGAQAACPSGTDSYIHPRVVSSAEAEFSEEARRDKFSGAVTIAVTVDADGQPTDPWVMTPIGYGLDEQAAKAVHQYRFVPASCGGEPVADQIAIAVNFQMF
jgi:TonB family protein